MKRRFVHVLVAAGAIALGFVVGQSMTTSAAFAQKPVAVVQSSVPQSYGPLKGAVMDLLLFEDSGGVIRGVNARNGTVTVEVTRR